MSQTIETSINIEAPINLVWRVLTDFNAYSQWNPFIKAIEGTAQVGQSLRITLVKPNGQLYTFKAKLLAYDPERLFSWDGSIPGTHWLFSGIHRFELHPPGPAPTVMTQKEQFSGLLSGLILKAIRADTEQGFRAMNEALKKRVLTLQAHKK